MAGEDTSGYHAVRHPSRELKGSDLTEYRLKVLEGHSKQGLANDQQIISMLGDQKTQLAVTLERMDTHNSKITEHALAIAETDSDVAKALALAKDAKHRVEVVEHTQSKAGWALLGTLFAALGALIATIFQLIKGRLP